MSHKVFGFRRMALESPGSQAAVVQGEPGVADIMLLSRVTMFGRSLVGYASIARGALVWWLCRESITCNDLATKCFTNVACGSADQFQTAFSSERLSSGPAYKVSSKCPPTFLSVTHFHTRRDRSASTMNSSSAIVPASCNFASISDVLTQADNGALNVTLIVQQCSNICSLVWGQGNPDLSGIGVSQNHKSNNSSHRMTTFIHRQT
jgi:hypothetical protein